MDELGLPAPNVLAYTMPGFATSDRTCATPALMGALGVDARTRSTSGPRRCRCCATSVTPPPRRAVYDVTYENVQAGARTSLLFRLANQHDALVVGTGDLSELALGWCTYGVGDHMSHYGVNASVPKTLIQYLVRWVGRPRGPRRRTPHDAGRDPGHRRSRPSSCRPRRMQPTSPHQRSESVVGPYELQDFLLYYVLRFGYRPSKVAYLAHHAWGDRDDGDWPAARADAPPTSTTWRRSASGCGCSCTASSTSQFKRSALPDGPKVGSGGSLSPRGDWRAPSDATAAAWLAELDALKRGSLSP